MRDDLLQKVVGIVALGGRVEVLAAPPAVAAVHDDHSQSDSLVGQVLKCSGKVLSTAPEKILRGTAIAREIVNSQKLGSETRQPRSKDRNSPLRGVSQRVTFKEASRNSDGLKMRSCPESGYSRPRGPDQSGGVSPVREQF
jgi:hypothetical protein